MRYLRFARSTFPNFPNARYIPASSPFVFTMTIPDIYQEYNITRLNDINRVISTYMRDAFTIERDASIVWDNVKYSYAVERASNDANFASCSIDEEEYLARSGAMSSAYTLNLTLSIADFRRVVDQLQEECNIRLEAIMAVYHAQPMRPRIPITHNVAEELLLINQRIRRERGDFYSYFSS
jgi:hypothetical protein